MSVYPECIRCGMCCIVAPCCFSKAYENSVCIYLLINKDDTTTCINNKARTEYSGSGCIFMRPIMKECYNEQMEVYCINERKQEIKLLYGHGGA